MKELKLSGSLTTSLASGHPWVYRDHVGDFSAKTGSWVRVVSGSFSAVGLWDEESAIAVRIFSTKGPVDGSWLQERVREAWDIREPLREQGVTGYRLLFGEGDGLPGVTVDLYDGYAILVTYSKSLGAIVQPLAMAISEVCGVKGVVRRVKTDDGVRLLPLVGEPPPSRVQISEFGMKLLSDLEHGQKTGLFFDHRDNRQYVRECSKGARVLNLFSYTGGFSVAAALGGASHVVSVDIARPAIEASRENFELNGLDASCHEAIAGDVFDYLARAQKAGEKFDVVVCDPPTFAKSRAQLKVAEKAYRKLMAQALSLVRDGGLFCAASCTSQIGPAAFRLAIVDAARKARIRYRVVRDIGQPVDHPVSVAHEEGRYLKFVAGRVFDRC